MRRGIIFQQGTAKIMEKVKHPWWQANFEKKNSSNFNAL